jgi:hypothetical protein
LTLQLNWFWLEEEEVVEAQMEIEPIRDCLNGGKLYIYIYSIFLETYNHLNVDQGKCQRKLEKTMAQCL